MKLIFFGKSIEVSYRTRLGEERSFFIIPLPGRHPLVEYPRQKLPGFLYRLFETLEVFAKLLDYSWKSRKYKKNKEKPKSN